MKKNFKKIISTLLILSCIFSFNISSVLANSDTYTERPLTEAELQNHESSNEGVTTVNPGGSGGIALRGTSPPTIYQNLNKAPLTFSGNAQKSTLFTDKGFTGKSGITINVKNYHSKQVRVYIHSSNGAIAKSFDITGKSTGSFTTKVSASTKYYLSFIAPSNFSGNVR